MAEYISSIFNASLNVSRRRFVQGLAAGGVLAGCSNIQVDSSTRTLPAFRNVPELRGKEFSLVAAETPVNFTGQRCIATTINGSLPAPTLRMRQGDTVSLRVTNKMREATSIHWHGILLPYQMDGVPGVSFPGIAPGETFEYRFKLVQSGTYWYHSHSLMQEITGMYGAIIIDPPEGSAQSIQADRDHVMLLSDWSDEDPMRMLAKLKAQGDYYNPNRPTVADFAKDVYRNGFAAALDRRMMWSEMRMNPTDLADVSGDTLTYLINGTTPAGNWTAQFAPGERVRLRFINGAGHTFFDVRIPGEKLVVVHVDGVDVDPVTVDEFRIGPGQTCDVIVKPQADACTVFAQSMDRSGFARATLAVSPELQAPVPRPDPVQWLTMGDMGHGNHGAHAGNASHAGHAMHHGGMAMDHSKHGAPASRQSSLHQPTKTVRHDRNEDSAAVDMKVDMPRTNLDDPGVGLRRNGRRVLTLADLHSIGGPLDPREPGREIELHLTGNMERYSWSLDGLEFGRSEPVRFHAGERLRVILQNDTMMTHPMHLHGMWSELESPNGEFQARLHTIPVQPAQRISFLVTADALGRWVWHCHLMFHMDMGMFREVVVA